MFQLPFPRAIELSLTPIPGNLITQADRTHIFTSVVSGSYAGALAGLNTIRNRWGAVSNRYILVTWFEYLLTTNAFLQLHIHG